MHSHNGRFLFHKAYAVLRVRLTGCIVTAEFILKSAAGKTGKLEKAREPEADKAAPDTVHFITFDRFCAQVDNGIEPNLVGQTLFLVPLFQPTGPAAIDKQLSRVSVNACRLRRVSAALMGAVVIYIGAVLLKGDTLVKNLFRFPVFTYFVKVAKQGFCRFVWVGTPGKKSFKILSHKSPSGLK